MSYCIIIIWNVLLHLIALFLTVEKICFYQKKCILFENSWDEGTFLWKNAKAALLQQQEHLLAVNGGLDLPCVFLTPSCFPLRRRIRSGSGNSMGKNQSRFCAKCCAIMVGHSILQLYHTGQLQSVTTDTLKDGKTQKRSMWYYSQLFCFWVKQHRAVLQCMLVICEFYANEIHPVSLRHWSPVHSHKAGREPTVRLW